MTDRFACYRQKHLATTKGILFERLLASMCFYIYQPKERSTTFSVWAVLASVQILQQRLRLLTHA